MDKIDEGQNSLDPKNPRHYELVQASFKIALQWQTQEDEEDKPEEDLVKKKIVKKGRDVPPHPPGDHPLDEGATVLIKYVIWSWEKHGFFDVKESNGKKGHPKAISLKNANKPQGPCYYPLFLEALKTMKVGELANFRIFFTNEKGNKDMVYANVEVLDILNPIVKDAVIPSSEFWTRIAKAKTLRLDGNTDYIKGAYASASVRYEAASAVLAKLFTSNDKEVKELYLVLFTLDHNAAACSSKLGAHVDTCIEAKRAYNHLFGPQGNLIRGIMNPKLFIMWAASKGALGYIEKALEIAVAGLKMFPNHPGLKEQESKLRMVVSMKEDADEEGETSMKK